MASHTTHIRRICSRPWRNGSRANPSKIPTCIQVGVRPETTSTHETVFESYPQLPACRTALACISGTHVFDDDPGRSSLVFHKTLQLPECPTMESRAHAPVGMDTLADVGEIFHYNLRRSNTLGLRNNAFADFVISMCDMPPLSAGDLPEPLMRTLAAIGLKTTTQGKMLIAPMAQGLTTPDSAGADGGELIFPDIHPHDWTRCYRFAVVRFDDKIESPAATAKNQFRLLWCTIPQDSSLMVPEDHLHEHTPMQSVERDSFALERISTAVEVNACAVEPERRNGRVTEYAAQGSLRAVRLANLEDDTAHHLSPKDSRPAQVLVPQPVQGYPIPTTLLLNDRNEAIAGIGVSNA